MIYEPSALAIGVFLAIVGLTLGLSFYLGAQARSAKGYFAAGGGIHWFVNGVAFAGDYLSAASFLGICGMIAFYGYDGFLYSIGFLAGWIVALLVVAEPLKRLGKYTLADALDHRFHSKGIKLAVAVSTLVASLFYLIPQMVGAGALIKPLLGIDYPLMGFENWVGVVLVGTVVTIIVATAGMVSTTYVQFLKGGLLVIFSFVLTVLVLMRGLTATTDPAAMEQQTVVSKAGETTKIVNGLPQGTGKGEGDFRPIGHVKSLPNGSDKTGPLGPIAFLKAVRDSEIIVWKKSADPNDKSITHYTASVKKGSELLTPGNAPTFAGIKTSGQWKDSLNFISLMLALFCGTASLPHILIRYYTVKDQASARKSTVVGIITIGLFYVLTLYIGLGAMTSGALDVTNNNMAAPLLARSFGEWLFAVISAIAFTTVLGTVSGLIIAAAGAVVHDLAGSVLGIEMNDHGKVRLAKVASVVVGIIAIVLGIVFEKMNVGFLVGWAFSIAASANLPALVMVLFWKRTTKEGVIAAVTVGTFSALAWVLLSKEAMTDVYGLSADNAKVPFSQPGIVTIPLSFLVLVVVSLLTKPQGDLAPIKH
jgi:cation/acetate symporter